MYVALTKLSDDKQSVLQVMAAILITILWGLMVVFPFIQVSKLDSEIYLYAYKDIFEDTNSVDLLPSFWF